jgi:hypothetical protein
VATHLDSDATNWMLNINVYQESNENENDEEAT